MEDILTTISVIGAIVILLQVMIIISYWRRGSKYVALERLYRERQAEANARESERTHHRLSDWDVDEEEDYAEDHLEVESGTEWDVRTALEEPPR